MPYLSTQFSLTLVTEIKMIKIFVNVKSDRQLVVYIRQFERVTDLKRKIYQETDICPSKQILVYKGGTLKDRQILTNCNLDYGSTIDLKVGNNHSVSIVGIPEVPALGNHEQKRSSTISRHMNLTLMKDLEKDRKLTAIEARTNGMLMLQRFYRDIEGYMTQSISNIPPFARPRQFNNSVISTNSNEPSNTPLPVLWSEKFVYRNE